MILSSTEPVNLRWDIDLDTPPNLANAWLEFSHEAGTQRYGVLTDMQYMKMGKDESGWFITFDAPNAGFLASTVDATYSFEAYAMDDPDPILVDTGEVVVND